MALNHSHPQADAEELSWQDTGSGVFTSRRSDLQPHFVMGGPAPALTGALGAGGTAGARRYALKDSFGASH
jgi:hypothetical protein